jgi:hypothetical protein
MFEVIILLILLYIAIVHGYDIIIFMFKLLVVALQVSVVLLLGLAIIGAVA